MELPDLYVQCRKEDITGAYEGEIYILKHVKPLTACKVYGHLREICAQKIYVPRFYHL